MGYTTEFQGKFSLDKLPQAEVIVALKVLEGADGRDLPDPSAPDAYCQWELTKDCRHIEWDGGEKFYKYVEWLQYINDKVLTPAGITLSGSVSYSGEEADDNGVLVIESGIVRQIENKDLPVTIEELRAFKSFVEQHRHGKQIMKEWRSR